MIAFLLICETGGIQICVSLHWVSSLADCVYRLDYQDSSKSHAKEPTQPESLLSEFL